MIIRKPYAFLIKNFRKLHVLILLLCAFVLYKTIDVFLFVNKFMSLGIYDSYANPVNKHITWFLTLSIILIIIGCCLILLVLHRKNKPWKKYLLPLIVYIVLFFSFSMIKGFFNSYTEIVETTNLRLSRDILVIIFIAEFPAIWVIFKRVFGLDTKEEDFNVDLEFLDLSEEDREEVEISFNVDFNTFKRWWKKFLRNIGYFYREHKIISISIISIFSIFIIYNLYIFIFVVNRVYKQGQLYNANGYTIRVVNAYYTDKDDAGKVISKDSDFVIAEIIVKNNREDRVFDTSNFHLKSGFKNYSTTEATYQKEFSDLGTCYSKVKKLKRDEEFRFIIIYKVNKTAIRRKFVIYYQETSGIYKLRKIKINTKDIRKVKDPVNLNLGDSFDYSYKSTDETLSIDSFKFEENPVYRVNKCNTLGCSQTNKTYESTEGYSVLVLDFGSDVFEAQNMIDFLCKYGTIIYKNDNGKTKQIEIKNAIDKKYYGKVVYIKVKNNVALSNDVSIDIHLRNDVYRYKLV